MTRILATVLVLCSCSSVGTQVRTEQLAQFKPGETSCSDIVNRIGVPDSTTTRDDGSKLMVYTACTSTSLSCDPKGIYQAQQVQQPK